MKIIFTGGGSGGHIFPIIAIIREIRRIYTKPDIQIFYIGPKDDFSFSFLEKEEIEIKKIITGKIRRHFTFKTFFQNIFDVLFRIPLGFLQSFFYVYILMPDLIFSKGGYGSFGPVLSGLILRVPVFIHESDIAAGFINRIFAKYALEIFTSFPETENLPKEKIIITGNPIRKEILEDFSGPEEIKKIFALRGGKPILLVLGGSQGAQRINNLLLEILPEILKNFELIHQCGIKNFKEVEIESKVILNETNQKFYHLFPVLNEIELRAAYKISDLIVSRAGSGIIFEIASCAKPSILIPLPESAQNHQIKNSYYLAKKQQAAVVIEEINLTPHLFLEKLNYLISCPAELKKMSENAGQFSKIRAGEIIAHYLINYLLLKTEE